MPTQIDRPGVFLAEIVDYGLKKSEQTESVAVSITARLLAMWTIGQGMAEPGWVEWAIYDQEASGDTWVIGKDGKLITAACDRLIKHAGWNGDFEAISNKLWAPCQCQVTVVADEYKGVKRYRIEFINDYGRTPGKFEELAADKVQNLAARFGPELRALAGSHRQQSVPAPAGKPAAPPALPGAGGATTVQFAPAATTTAVATPPSPMPPPPSDEVPFAPSIL